MPEGPEVRRHADALHSALSGKSLVALTARTKAARAWLEAHPNALPGRRVEQVRSYGKNLVGRIEGGYYFYSHLMMWGRWQVSEGSSPLPTDRRERARIVVPDASAILYSAPVFEVGEGEPFLQNEYLRTLGPDTLPYAGKEAFPVSDFLTRLMADENRDRTIGAALLDQRIAAGIGNYLRAEILFECRLDPWKPVRMLTLEEQGCLIRVIPEMAERAYLHGGRTVTEEMQMRMRTDPTLVYQPGREVGTHHYVFRRTNLPCLVCGDTIRQIRQVTWKDEEGEKTRILYFCPTCQSPSIEPTWLQRRPRRKNLSSVQSHTEEALRT